MNIREKLDSLGYVKKTNNDFGKLVRNYVTPHPLDLIEGSEQFLNLKENPGCEVFVPNDNEGKDFDFYKGDVGNSGVEWQDDKGLVAFLGETFAKRLLGEKSVTATIKEIGMNCVIVPVYREVADDSELPPFTWNVYQISEESK